MPQNQFQRVIYAVLTVIVTVHAFVFFSLYVVNGSFFSSLSATGSVIDGINNNGGILLCNVKMPIYAVVIIEFVLAVLLEVFIGGPLSFKLASKVFDPKTTHPVLFETAIISATVAIMCPLMSFIAAFLYYPYFQGFNMLTLLANFLKLVCFNFPFAFFSQLFFIQPLIRTVFKLIFVRKNKIESKA